MGISLNAIKNEIRKAGTSKAKILYFKDGTRMRVRFLVDFEDGMEIKFHDSFALGINVPCQEAFGRECEYCDNADLRTRSQYIWSVYDYESKEVKLLMAAVNNCSPIPSLASFYETYGTITDRDYEIRRIGEGQNTTYNIVPLDKKKFRNEKVKPLSDTAILKYINKAYPSDNSEDLEDYDDEEPRQNKKKGNKDKSKAKSKIMNEPADDEDWGEDEETETDYESMSAKELYNLCKERGISVKPRLPKDEYIDLLTDYDFDNEDDEDWGEDEEGLPFN